MHACLTCNNGQAQKGVCLIECLIGRKERREGGRQPLAHSAYAPTVSHTHNSPFPTVCYLLPSPTYPSLICFPSRSGRCPLHDPVSNVDICRRPAATEHFGPFAVYRRQALFSIGSQPTPNPIPSHPTPRVPTGQDKILMTPWSVQTCLLLRSLFLVCSL